MVLDSVRVTGEFPGIGAFVLGQGVECHVGYS